MQRGREMQTDTETDKWTHRQTDAWMDRQTHIDAEALIGRQVDSYRQTDRQTY